MQGMDTLMKIEERFKTDLINLGLEKDDTVLMHCSYKALGENISAKEIFDSILEVIGENGTLIMPAFSYNTVTYDNPVFDRKNTPSCVGFLPEYFRTEVEGVKRSMHATHSCCVIGKNTEYLIKNHELDITPVGENSPITKIPKLNGKILILGSHPDHSTTLHGVEEMGSAPYIFDLSKTIDYTLKDGETVINNKSFRHSFHREDCDYEQKYSRIIDILESKDYSFGKVLNADCYLFSAKAVWEKGVAKIKKEPLFFVNKTDK